MFKLKQFFPHKCVRYRYRCIEIIFNMFFIPPVRSLRCRTLTLFRPVSNDMFFKVLNLYFFYSYFFNVISIKKVQCIKNDHYCTSTLKSLSISNFIHIFIMFPFIKKKKFRYFCKLFSDIHGHVNPCLFTIIKHFDVGNVFNLFRVYAYITLSP